MRRLGLLILLCMCAMAAFSYNESVAAISFNPSRLGAYTHLKAVSEAALVGGLDTQENGAIMNIKSQDTVRLKDERTTESKCEANACKLNLGSNEAGNLNSIKDLKPDPAATDFRTSADMREAVLKKASSNPFSNGYTIVERQPTANQGTDIILKGGYLEAARDSHITEFVENDLLKKLEIAANKLTAKNAFHVREKFTLGQITVQSNDDACTSSCKSYQFVDRLDTETNQKYNVLAVKVK